MKGILSVIGVFILLIFISCRVTNLPIGIETETGDLIITEIGTTLNFDDSAWFELYNSGTRTLDLSDYQLRSRSISTFNFDWLNAISTFDFPPLLITPGSYVIVKAQINSDLNNGGQVAYIKKTNEAVPYWIPEYGFLELLLNGKTVDFVRFGTLENSLPNTYEEWIGGKTQALPAYSAADLAKSLARNAFNLDSNSPEDWSIRDFATPGGPNDVSSMVDSDSDGIPDESEVPGSTFAGLPLYDWGARIGVRDIFIHIDYMDSSDPAVMPDFSSLNKVVAAFAPHDIAIHFDVGNLFHPGSGVDPLFFDLDDSSHMVPFSKGLTIGYSGSADIANLYDYKDKYMDTARKQIFHYLLMGYTQSATGIKGSSGLAEYQGNDFIVTLGNWELVSGSNQLINFQASTLMHELGHNLGLHHGGFEDRNYKPNYMSIMNYLYQKQGLPTLGNNEDDRYLMSYYSIGTLDTLSNSPLNDPEGFIMDFSDGSSLDLDENNLSEVQGLGRTPTSGADYNGDGDTLDVLSKDVNYDSISGQIHSDYNDWANLELFFQHRFNGNTTGSRSLNTNNWIDVIGNDKQNVYPENDRPYLE